MIPISEQTNRLYSKLTKSHKGHKAIPTFVAAPQYCGETLGYSNFNDVIRNLLDSRVFTFDTIIRCNATQLCQNIEISLNSIQSITGLAIDLQHMISKHLPVR